MIAQTLSISLETAKKELGFWVSHGVIKESQLQRAIGEGEHEQAVVTTEIVFYASKTLDRAREKASVGDSGDK